MSNGILELVQRDGIELKDVEVQTPELCLAAVRQDGWALRFVDEQFRPLCEEAIRTGDYSGASKRDWKMAQRNITVPTMGM